MSNAFFASQFLYDSRSKTFCVEASDLGIKPGANLNYISIIGRKDTVPYKLYEVMSDLNGWIYLPDGSNVPGSVGTRVVILND